MTKPLMIEIEWPDRVDVFPIFVEKTGENIDIIWAKWANENIPELGKNVIIAFLNDTFDLLNEGSTVRFELRHLRLKHTHVWKQWHEVI